MGQERSGNFRLDRAVNHCDRQKEQHDAVFARGSREHVATVVPLTRYIVEWRIKAALRRIAEAANGLVSYDIEILLMCAGEGMEGSTLCDMGYRNVTVSDISEVAVAEALKRDKRLRGIALNAEHSAQPDRSFDLVIVQDGLHHLQNPVLGFTEMLRIARVGALFLEPHDSGIGRMLGTKWEKNGEAVNYVFRWTRKLVQDVASSYLPPDSFQNLSFSFWQHNILFDRVGKRLGGGRLGLLTIRVLKYFLDSALGKFGNQFCGLILKR